MKRTALRRKHPMKRTGRLSSKKPPQRRIKRLARKSKAPVSKLKEKLWQITRQIIIKIHGSDCYTCPAKTLSGSNRHVGHFISSSVCSAELRYALDNLRPQCYACNINRSGNWPAYESHLIADGIDVAALKKRNEETKGLKYDSLWYEAKILEREAHLEMLRGVSKKEITCG